MFLRAKKYQIEKHGHVFGARSSYRVRRALRIGQRAFRRPHRSMTIAVIDIGSNSIKALVARRDPAGGLIAVMSHTLDARLGTGLGKGPAPVLAEEGMVSGLAAVRELLGLVASHAPARIQLVATSAVRDAANGAAFRERVRAATGHEVRLLSGQEEADLIGRGLTTDPALAALDDFYVFDLGGGSLECLAFRDRRCAQALSLRLGCVRLTERFVPDPSAVIPPGVAAEIARHTRAELRGSGFRFNLPDGAPAVLTGGAMTTVRLLWGADHGVGLAETPSVYTLDTLEALLDRLGPLDLAARRALPGMPAARADVFPAALVTLYAVAELSCAPMLHHSLHNLRWGLAAELLD